MDIALLNFVQEHLRSGFGDFFFPAVTCLGNYGLFWITAAAALLFSKKYRRFGAMLLAALALSHIVGEDLIKPLAARPRPFVLFPGHPLLIAAPAGFSFPSGHAASGFCAAFILWKANRHFGLSALILAALIAFSRIYLFVHYPADVLAGAVLGVICALFTVKFFEKYLCAKE